MNYSEQLAKLNLRFIQENVDAFLTRMKKNPSAALQWWLDNELESLRLRSEERRLVSSKLGCFTSLGDFEWSAVRAPADLRLQIQNLINKQFVGSQRNVILIGPEGAGKTALAKILGKESVLQGHSCLFTTTADMISDLNLADHPMARQRNMAKYIRPNLLVLDELGYVSCNENSADNLFQVVAKRYEMKRSIVVTTNLAFSDWPKALGGAHCTTAIVDRLIENSTVIDLDADSYRLTMHKKDNFSKISGNPKKDNVEI